MGPIIDGKGVTGWLSQLFCCRDGDETKSLFGSTEEAQNFLKDSS